MRGEPLLLAILVFALVKPAIGEEVNWPEFFKEHETLGRSGEAAFECAALAARFDIEEHNRLLRFGVEQGQEFMTVLMNAQMPEIEPGEDKSIDLEVEEGLKKLGWESSREFIAFALGQAYAAAERSATKHITSDDARSDERWKASHKREYDKRNCKLIGK